ncbi:hypothetical protein Ga0080559_TMP5190 (plasmid) [Salipiger profundus]|uniref:Uncharacterized protein n=1 Tax=Salipiger profundus TaxID=1229727 RepID=A0A1U7DDZ9_9RHOB|nr:hypothetical protein Ga0080559_TMP5190 [Salipiger profundus]
MGRSGPANGRVFGLGHLVLPRSAASYRRFTYALKKIVARQEI